MKALYSYNKINNDNQQLQFYMIIGLLVMRFAVLRFANNRRYRLYNYSLNKHLVQTNYIV